MFTFELICEVLYRSRPFFPFKRLITTAIETRRDQLNITTIITVLTYDYKSTQLFPCIHKCLVYKYYFF